MKHLIMLSRTVKTNHVYPQMPHLYVLVEKPLALKGKLFHSFWEGFVLNVGTLFQDFVPIETLASARSDTEIDLGGRQMLLQLIHKLFDRVQLCALCRPARLFHTRLCKSFNYCPPFVYRHCHAEIEKDPSQTVSL